MLKFLILVVIFQELLNHNKLLANKQIKRNIDNSNSFNKIDSTKPYSSINNLLLNQKPLDCHQFDTDIIECFAYNLFLKNSYKLTDLNSENVLSKPILTKNFENKTVKEGQNVTFTCQTQIDALPIFLFYKLNKDIVKKYNSIKLDENAKLLDLFSEPLQDAKSFNDYTTTNQRIKLQRKEHVEDSNKDSLSDLETVNLEISNATTSDTGYYLCIVANSLKSFRVTYAFLKVILSNEIISNKNDDLLLKDYIDRIILSCLFSISLCVSICCYFCSCNRKGHDKFEFMKNDEGVNSLIEKSLNSMKKNFIYVSMQNQSSGRNSASTENLSINLMNNKCGMEKTLLHNYKNSAVVSNKNEQMPFDFNEENLYLHQFENFDYLKDFSSWEFPREKLKLGSLIDEGAFGRVYKGEAFGIIPGHYKSTVAIKTLKDNFTKNEFLNFIRELEIMKNIGKHENIISLLGCITKAGPLYAIVEYAKFGNLKNYLRTQRPKDYMFYTDVSNDSHHDFEQENNTNYEDNYLSNILKLYSKVNKAKTLSKSKSVNKPMSTFGTLRDVEMSGSNTIVEYDFDLLEFDSLTQINLIIELIKYCVQISNGMKFLHTKKVCHRDLAARNVLLDENKVAKIADFGFARDLQQNYYYKRKSEAPIPVKWMAPETLFDRKVYQNSDIWSFGVLMWEVFTLGGNPYPTVQVEKLFEYLKEGNRMSKPMYSDDEIYQLILECWSFKPDLRPSFDIINQRLSLILEKYELKKTQKLNNSTIEKLFDDKTMNDLKNIGLNFNTLAYSPAVLSNTLSSKQNNMKSLTINSSSQINIDCPPLLPSTSSSIITMLSSRTNNTAKFNNKLKLKHNSNRQSESEDSQYFSGAENSLLYADNSQFSSASLNYTHYSVPLSDEAVKAASIMVNQLDQSPPSPPPLKPSSKLLNVASAAYQL